MQNCFRISRLLMAASLLLQAQFSESEESGWERQSRFEEAVEYWTGALCTLQKTKTVVFHGVFANATKMLKDFFDILLYTTAEYCNAVVLLKIYNLPNFPGQDLPNANTVNSNREQSNANRSAESHRHCSETCNENVKGEMNECTPAKGNTEGVKYLRNNASSRKLMPMANRLHRKWNIRRYWRRNDEYFIDIWRLNVIFLGDDDSFVRLLDFNATFQWNSREHFVVLAVWNDLLGGMEDRRPLIDNTLRKLWLRDQILNVLFDEPLSHRRGLNLYSYNPFAANDKAWGQLERVDGTSKRGMLRSLSTLTYRRTVNFDGYRFNVSIFDQEQEEMKIPDKINPRSVYAYSGGYGGPNGILLGVVAKKLNFTVNVIEPRTAEKYGHRMENETFSGAIGDVAYRRVVASFDSFFVKKYADDHVNSVEFTTAVSFDQICVIVPKADEIPRALRILNSFQSSVWLCLMLSCILLYLTWRYVVQTFSPPRVKGVGSQANRGLGVFFNATSRPIVLPSAIAERNLLAGLIFSSVTLTGIFHGILYKSFATRVFYADINTLHELDASGLPIAFHSRSTEDLFGSESNSDLNPILKRLPKKMIHVSSHVIPMAAYYRNISGLLRDRYFNLVQETFVDERGRHMLHKVDECPARFHLACLLPSNSFLRERINIMIGRLNQAGLPLLWRTRTMLQQAIKMNANVKQHHKKREEQMFTALRLNDLWISFLILATGLMLSAIVFLNEKGWLKLFPRRSKWNSFPRIN